MPLSVILYIFNIDGKTYSLVIGEPCYVVGYTVVKAQSLNLNLFLILNYSTNVANSVNRSRQQSGYQFNTLRRTRRHENHL